MESNIPIVKIAGWKIPIVNRKYIFNPGAFSIPLLDDREVNFLGLHI